MLLNGAGGLVVKYNVVVVGWNDGKPSILYFFALLLFIYIFLC